MRKRKKYNFERLDKYCKENNVVLLEDYSNAEMTKNSQIKGNCIYENCKNNFEKKFDNLSCNFQSYIIIFYNSVYMRFIQIYIRIFVFQ